MAYPKVQVQVVQSNLFNNIYIFFFLSFFFLSFVLLFHLYIFFITTNDPATELYKRFSLSSHKPQCTWVILPLSLPPITLNGL